MDKTNIFLNEYPLQKLNGNQFLEPLVPEWQPLSPPDKNNEGNADFRMRQFPPETPVKRSYRSYSFLEDKENDKEWFSPASNSCFKNTDFFSAIPYARSSYTVKRKLNYEDENRQIPNMNVKTQTTKTYFPFEYIGRATRNTKSQSNDKDIEGNNGIVVTGQALRRLEVNGNAFNTSTSTELSTPMKIKKPGKIKPKLFKEQAVVENHIKQIQRKHAEFNWNTIYAKKNDNKAMKKNGEPQENVLNDLDSQRVPSSPFVEKYNSPSLYSLNETPFNQKCIENLEIYPSHYSRQGEYTSQHSFKTNSPKCWSESHKEFPENTCGENAQLNHLFPF